MIRSFGSHRAFVMTVGLAAGFASNAFAERYDVFEVPLYSSLVNNRANGIGPDGTVVGAGDYVFGGTLAFKWNPNSNALNGMWWPGNDGNSVAYDINSSNYACGSSFGNGAFRGIRWDQALFPLDFNADTRDAMEINELGYVFGTTDYLGTIRAYIWDPFNNSVNILTHLGGGSSVGLDGNNDNDACGYSLLANNSDSHAFLYRRSGGMIDLGTIDGDTGSYGMALNDDEEVICQSIDFNNFGQTDSFIYDNGNKIRIGRLPGYSSTYGKDINNRRQVVGYVTSGGAKRAFIWESGSIIDLNELIPGGTGWVLEEAVAINDNGDIAGNGTLNGEPKAFLLRGLSLSVSGRCPGTATVVVSNATPGAIVALEYSANAGSFTIPNNYGCAGTLVRLGLPLLPGSPAYARANAAGVATFSGPVGANLCGRIRLQAIDAATCRTSNVDVYGD